MTDLFRKMIKIWQNLLLVRQYWDKIMTNILQKYEQNMTKDHDNIMTEVWHEYDTNMISIYKKYDSNMTGWW